MQKEKVVQLIIAATLSLLVGGCSVLRPVRSAESTDSSAYFIAPTRAATPTAQQTVQATSAADAQPANCTNLLTYKKDLTLPDGSFVTPGSSLDKQWQVTNSGTCNWNDSYTIRLVDGDLLGATSPQAIVPARSSTDATIRIVFTAPTQPGNYSSTWQAFDPKGQTFGDYFKIVINVAGN
jgi:hypothetical protein